MLLVWVSCGALPSVASAAPGELDLSFGAGGWVRTPIGDQSLAYAVGQQSDGKLVVAGCSQLFEPGFAPSQFAVVRYTTSGVLDPSFGDNGIASVSFPGGSSACADDLAIRPDDSIVLVGIADRVVGDSSVGDFAVAQLTSGGALDPSFGSGGRVMLHPGSPDGAARATAVALDPSGRAIVAGEAWTEPLGDTPHVPGFAAVRLEPDGTLDTSFGEGGEFVLEMTETTPVPLGTVPGSGVADLARYPDGRIALIGTAYDDWQDDGDHQFRYRLAIARLTTNGQLDPSFSGDGTLVTSVRNPNDFVQGAAVALTPGGGLAAGGYDQSTVTGTGGIVARFSEDGSLDPSFGTAGSTLVDAGGVMALRYQADGKLVTTASAFAVERLTAAGTPDPSFGAGGLALGPPLVNAGSQDLLLEPSGKIIVAGYAADQSAHPLHFTVVRYQGDPPPPSDRDGDGIPDDQDQCPDASGIAPTGCPGSSTSAPPPSGPPRRGLEVRAVGDSVTAAFGYSSSGKPVGLGRFLSTCVWSPSNKHCQSPDVTAYPAIWAKRMGVPLQYPSFANYAKSGSTPEDWIEPGAPLHDELKQVVADDPDVILLTLGGNPLLTDFAFGLLGQVCMFEVSGELVRICFQRKLAKYKTVSRLTRIYDQLLDAHRAVIGVFLYHKTYPKTVTHQKADILFSELNSAIATAFTRARKQRTGGASRLKLLNSPSFDAHQCGSPQPWVLSIDTCIHPNVAGQRAYARVITGHLFPNGLP